MPGIEWLEEVNPESGILEDDMCKTCGCGKK